LDPCPGRSQIELLALASKGKLEKDVLCSRVAKMNYCIICILMYFESGLPWQLHNQAFLYIPLLHSGNPKR